MSIISAEEAERHLNVTSYEDGIEIGDLIDAAEAFVDRWLPEGEKLADRDPVPADLKLAIKMLVGHWYENREATLVGISAEELPLGVWDIINQHRGWAF